METQTDGWPKAGLRERKKARTRAEIQRQALRLHVTDLAAEQTPLTNAWLVVAGRRRLVASPRGGTS